LQQLQLGLGMKFDPGLVDIPLAAGAVTSNGAAEAAAK